MRTGCVFSRGRAIVAFPALAVADADGCGEDSGVADFEGEDAAGRGEDSGVADFDGEGTGAGCALARTAVRAIAAIRKNEFFIRTVPEGFFSRVPFEGPVNRLPAPLIRWFCWS
jgi:hypothetical protein